MRTHSSNQSPGSALRWLLETCRHGAGLTASHYLKPDIVRDGSARFDWYPFGKPPAREVDVHQLVSLRDQAKVAGLVRRRGRELLLTRRGVEALRAADVFDDALFSMLAVHDGGPIFEAAMPVWANALRSEAISFEHGARVVHERLLSLGFASPDGPITREEAGAVHWEFTRRWTLHGLLHDGGGGGFASSLRLLEPNHPLVQRAVGPTPLGAAEASDLESGDGSLTDAGEGPVLQLVPDLEEDPSFATGQAREVEVPGAVAGQGHGVADLDRRRTVGLASGASDGTGRQVAPALADFAWAEQNEWSDRYPIFDGPSFHQLAVTLLDVEPTVSRRVLVDSNMPLPDLRKVLIAAMGWHGHHLHTFHVAHLQFGPPIEEMETIIDERGVTVRQVLPNLGDTAYWDYDFGDGWRHLLTVEKIAFPRESVTQPSLVSAHRACPPEDVGGPGGYHDFLQALADPQHADHRQVRQWAPKGFNAERVDFQLRSKLVRSATSSRRR